MKKAKLIVAGLLSVMLAVQSVVPVQAFTISRPGGSTSNSEDDEEDYADTDEGYGDTDEGYGDDDEGYGDDDEDYADDDRTSSELYMNITKKEEKIVDSKKDYTLTEVVEPADVVFVIDSTGSMEPYIRNVKNNVEDFSGYLLEQGIEANFAVVEYKDITSYGEKDSTIIHKNKSGSVWHKSVSELEETLSAVQKNVYGGGDAPETLLDALATITDGKSLEYNKGTHKFAIILTDATYKKNNSKDLSEDQIFKNLSSRKINTSVITRTAIYDKYESLVGKNGILSNIYSKDFSSELEKIADEMRSIVEKEVAVKTEAAFSAVDIQYDGGDKAKLVAIANPKGAKEQTIEWEIEDSSVAGISISKDTLTCNITAKEEGETKVTAISKDKTFLGTYTIDITSVSPEEEEEVIIPAIRIGKGDLTVTPAKKTIKKKGNVTVKVTPTSSFKKDFSEEELDEILDEDIDQISYRSTNSSVASVNGNGKVTGKKKGTAYIKTTIVLADATEITYKTKIYVK